MPALSALLVASSAFAPKPALRLAVHGCMPSDRTLVLAWRHSAGALSMADVMPNRGTTAADGYFKATPPVVPLPKAVNTICAFVFCQMLSEGIAISSLPLHLTRLGASAVQVGTATSCFSLAQMVFSPACIALAYYFLSNAKMLRLCLFGASLSSVLISLAATTKGVILGRTLAGLFAASVPVAQAAVVYIVPSSMTARALGRISAFAQLGVIIGPAVSAALQFLFAAVARCGGWGVQPDFCARATFAMSGLSALLVAITSSDTTALIEEKETEVFRDKRVLELRETANTRRQERRAQLRYEAANPPPMPPGMRPRKKGAEAAEVTFDEEEPVAETAVTSSPLEWLVRIVDGVREVVTQPLLRLMAMTVGFSLTLSVSTYCLLGDKFFGYGQSQLSGIFSAGAAITIFIQLLVFPRLVYLFGERHTASGGLLLLSAGLSGLSLVRVQPFHFMFYLLNRAGSAIADTSTVTLVSRTSENQAQRARNLGFIQSARALARVISPIACGGLFARSATMAIAPGGLPYLLAAAFALAISPVPLLLATSRGQGREDGDDDALLAFGADPE